MSDPQTLPPFPVDDSTLNLIEHAMSGCFTVDEEGEHHWQGSDMQLATLLDFLSGRDPNDEGILIGYADGTGWPIYDCTGSPRYSEHDVIGALIAEIRRLRGGSVPGEPR